MIGTGDGILIASYFLLFRISCLVEIGGITSTLCWMWYKLILTQIVGVGGDALHVMSEHILNATCGSPPGRNSSLFLYWCLTY
jgi:hypothetical protein